ncbi:MAG TPA: methylmalonyl-CoA epimerase [Nitriliruptorales bacterium]|nr:methylmalonyl-CoA epimerase [Nitriliruptorales bacterium]
MQLGRIDQVAFAVEDLDAAIELWQGVFGATLEYREVVDSDLVEEAMLRVGDGYIQLITPTSDGSTVARFLARRGPGLHHVGFAVPSVADAIDHLKAAGVRLIDQRPRRGGGGHTVAFVHPQATGGVLVELVEDGADRG